MLLLLDVAAKGDGGVRVEGRVDEPSAMVTLGYGHSMAIHSYLLYEGYVRNPIALDATASASCLRYRSTDDYTANGRHEIVKTRISPKSPEIPSVKHYMIVGCCRFSHPQNSRISGSTSACLIA